MSIKKGLLAILLLTVFLACKNDPLNIDSSKVDVSISYYNMDSVFTHATPDELPKWNKKFKDEINDAYMYELAYGLKLESDDDSTILTNIQLFRKDSFMMQFEDQIRHKFPNPIEQYKKVVDGFRNLKFHFPKMNMPRSIVIANSVFQSSAFATQEELVIGIERYLGKDNEMIQQLPPQVFYNWIKEGMEEKYLERDALGSWISTHLVLMEEGNLAENMINWGKILYFTQAAFPEMSDDLIMRYSPEDLKWAEENEESFWKYLKKEKMLFRINQDESVNMLGSGPFTPGLPEKGPDRLGQFLGWKMVSHYMEEKDITVKQLLKEPYDKILQAYEID